MRSNKTLTALAQSSQRLCSLLWSSERMSLRKGAAAIAVADIFDSNQVVIVSFAPARADFLKSHCYLSAAAPSWSPDGHRLAVIGTCSENRETQTLHILGVDDGREGRWHLHHRIDEWGTLTWAPDARRIAFTGRTGETDSVFVLDLGTSQTKAIASGSEPSWSPAGRWIAYVRRTRSRRSPRVEIRMTDASGTRDSVLLTTDDRVDLDREGNWVALSTKRNRAFRMHRSS